MEDYFEMPFGKHKGENLYELPSGYLKWLAENCDWNTEVQEEADEEFWHRDQSGTHIWED